MKFLGNREGVVGNMSFKTVYQKYFPSLCFFAHRFVEKQFTEDLVQDVFLKVWNARLRFDSERAMRVYLYVAVKNACIDFLRRKKNRDKYQKNVERTAGLKIESFFEEIIKEEASQILDQALETLSKKNKEVMFWVLKGYSNKEIARKLNISVNTIKTHKLLAFKKIRTWFEEQFPGVSPQDIMYLLFLIIPRF